MLSSNQEQQPKKQIRRRLHTNKPHQQRFLNMAEARREIATALKFHRASMKQQQQQQETANHDHQSPPRERAPATTNNRPMSTYVPPPLPLNQENFNLVLPNQTLGLSLNFKDFNNLTTSVYYNPMAASSGLSTAKDVAVVKAARWCKSMETIEVGTKEHDDDDDEWFYHPFEQVMEFPPWLMNTNETSCFQHIFDHHCYYDYSPHDPALPCMDIGEIEGMDGEEWLE
ncbi:hypothetical protein QVD17_00581 [Tagetes erecta]|uniref:Uncharacterized protein n=1 Tax=Tagetes erecta TaxID=13708 RepID=A0AAD8L4U5_TARER|nr:hypothetical protein QVD17_00581 [Tagetes erecta]